MKIRYLTIFATFLILLVLGTVLAKMPQFAASNRSNEPIPYIYYYSDLHHAWVIERADGTDSRLLGQGLMPEDYEGIGSLGWSPSGRWLAWSGYQTFLSRNNSGSNTPPKLWIISSDGQSISHLFDNFEEDVLLVKWAHNQDYLLVVSGQDYPDYFRTIRIVDVANQQILAESRWNFSYFSYDSAIDVHWAADDSAVYFTDKSVVVSLHTDGSQNIWNLGSSVYQGFAEHYVLYLSSAPGDGYFPSILDIETGESYSFLDRSGLTENLNYRFYWNEQGTHVVIKETICNRNDYNDCQNQLYLLNWMTKQQTELPASFSIQNASIRSYYAYINAPHYLDWSPNGQAVLLQEGDANVLFDVETLQSYRLNIYAASAGQWLENSDFLFWYPEIHTAYRFSWQNKTVEEYTRWTSEAYDTEFSPDGSLMGFTGQYSVLVQDVTTGEEHRYPRASFSTFTPPALSYQWNMGENHDWFFSGSNRITADGGVNSSAIMLHSIHEPLGRELTICESVYSCVGFLPDVVLPYLTQGQEESFTPTASQILLHSRDVQTVAWNSDGTALASYSNAESQREPNLLSIWIRNDTKFIQTESHFLSLYCYFYMFSDCFLSWLDTDTIQIENDDSMERYNLRTRTTEEINREVADNNFYQNPHYYLARSDIDNLVYLYDSQDRLVSANGLEDFDFDPPNLDYNPVTGLMVITYPIDRGQLWDVRTGKKISNLPWTGRMAVFSPDGRQLAVAASEFVTIWDMSQYIDN